VGSPAEDLRISFTTGEATDRIAGPRSVNAHEAARVLITKRYVILELATMTRMPILLAPALALSVLVVALAGCRREATVDAAKAQAPAPVQVRAAAVIGQDEPVTLSATGSFVADEESDVAPEASGRVVATPVDVGQFVREGAVLVRLRSVDAGLRLDEAKAAVARAEATVKLAESQNRLAQTTAERYERLLVTGDLSREVADQAKTQAETSNQNVATARASLAEAQAQLALAEKAFADVVVAAPFAGFISARNVSVGEYVQPSTPVLKLLKIDPLRLQLVIPGSETARVARGQHVTATVDAFPGKVFAGEITAVNPAIVQQSRSLIVEARVPNPDAVLKPGMFAVAQVDQGRTARTLIVPRAAVIEDANTNSYRVFIIDRENRARLRVVLLAPRQSGDTVHLVSGVKEGERVATSSLAQLYDSAPVRVSGPAAAQSPAGKTPGSERGGHAEAR
jgi:RND family efflux transporter MFP subunit